MTINKRMRNLPKKIRLYVPPDLCPHCHEKLYFWQEGKYVQATGPNIEFFLEEWIIFYREGITDLRFKDKSLPKVLEKLEKYIEENKKDLQPFYYNGSL